MIASVKMQGVVRWRMQGVCGRTQGVCLRTQGVCLRMQGVLVRRMAMHMVMRMQKDAESMRDDAGSKQ